MTDENITINEKKSTAFPVLLAVASILILVLMVRGCSQEHMVNGLQLSNDSLKKENTAVKKLIIAVIRHDSITRRNQIRDSITWAVEKDSMQTAYKDIWFKYVAVKQKLFKAYDDLSSTVQNTDTAALLAKLQDFRQQLVEQSDLVDMLNVSDSQKDSAYASRVIYLDSVIRQKDQTIDSLIHYYSGIQKQMDVAIAQVDSLIKQVKKGKRNNFFRTLGEIGLVMLLIFKK